MNKDILKRSMMAKLPEGALRELVPDGDEDRLYSGIAEALEGVANTLAETANTREPSSTSYPVALQREYGFLPDEELSDARQRARVKALKYAKRGEGTAQSLQEALHAAGFTELSVDPVRKDDTAMLDTILGDWNDLVVNGFEYLTQLGYDVTCQSDLSITCADPPEYTCVERNLIRAGVPYTISANRNLVFIVSSGITKDEDGYILSLTAPEIPRYYRNVIREIILRCKSTGTWGLMAIDWADDNLRYGFGFFPMGISPHGL